MTRRDRRLQRVRTKRAAEFFRAIECGQSAVNQQLIPARSILIEQQDRLAVRADSRVRSRRMQLHQREQSVHFRLVRRESRENAPESHRFVAERGTHPVIAGRRRVTFVENEIDDFEHRR